MTTQRLARQLARFRPAVSRHWLLAVAGIMWAGVGVMLCSYAYTWLTHPPSRLALAAALVGAAIALAAGRFGFTGMARKNIDRILSLPGKACVFAFQAWRGYLIIVGMISLGIFLRHSPLPKVYLAVVYLAIGGALLMASVSYFTRLRLLLAPSPAHLTPEE